MKKTFVLAAIFCLCLQAVSVFAATPNFTGYWELDISKSILPEMMRIESMTLKVMQTEKELRVESATKRVSGEMSGATIGGGRRGGGGNLMQAVVYNLDGKELTSEINVGMTTGKENRKATLTTDGRLSLTLTRNFNDVTGNTTIKTNDTWELLDEGNTLKVTRYMETPRGATNAEMYFTKKSLEATVKPNGEYQGQVMKNGEPLPKQISGGVLNGKALKLPRPAYPAAARAVRASGAVSVQVTVDEQGNIISASAISGHLLLRQAAEEAARDAKFSTTMIQGVPVRITGVIVYNFTP